MVCSYINVLVGHSSQSFYLQGQLTITVHLGSSKMPCCHQRAVSPTSFFTSPCALQCCFSLSSRLAKGGTSHRRKGAFHFTLTRSPLSSLSRWGLRSLPTMREGGGAELGPTPESKPHVQITLVTQRKSCWENWMSKYYREIVSSPLAKKEPF